MSTNTSLSFLAKLSKYPEESDWRKLFEIYSPLMHRWLVGYGVADHDI